MKEVCIKFNGLYIENIKNSKHVTFTYLKEHALPFKDGDSIKSAINNLTEFLFKNRIFPYKLELVNNDCLSVVEQGSMLTGELSGANILK